MPSTLTWSTGTDWDNAQAEDDVVHPGSDIRLETLFFDDAEDGDASEYSETGSAGSAGVVQESAPDGGSYSLYVDQNKGSGTSYEIYTDNIFDWNTTHYVKALVKSDNFDSSAYLGTNLGWRGRHGDSDEITFVLFNTDPDGVEQPLQFGGGGTSNQTTHSIGWQSNSWLWLEAFVDEGNSKVYGKAWYDGNSKPSSWQFDADITTGITGEEFNLHSNGTSSTNLDLDMAFFRARAHDGYLDTAEKIS